MTGAAPAPWNAAGPRDAVWFALACAACLPVAVQTAVYRPFVVDDAFITYRYAANLAAGSGLTFNPGLPPVEGYANVALVWAAAGLLRLGLDPVPIVKSVCAAFALGSVPLLFAFCRLLGARPGAAAAACWFLGLSASFSFWAVGGLETAVAAFLVLAGAHLFAREERSADLAAAAIFALAALTRFEAPAFLAAAGLHRAAGAMRRREAPLAFIARNLPWAALFLGLFGGYFLWRWRHFGALLPNPIYAKAASGPAGWLDSTAVNFLKGWWPFVAVGALSLFARGRGSSLPIVLVATALLAFANAQRFFAESVSTMSWLDRYFVPVLPMVAAAATLALDRAWSGGAARRAAVVAAGLGLAAWELANPHANPRRAFTRMKVNAEVVRPVQRALVERLAARFGPGASVALGDIGYTGYLYRGTILDLYGLTSYDYTLGARRDIPRYMDMVLEKRPDAIVLIFTLVEGAPKIYQYPDHVLQTRPAFKANYRRAESVGEELSRYYYAIYERTPEGAPEGAAP